MTGKNTLSPDLLAKLRLILRLTHLGMIAEQATRAFWPLWSFTALILGLLILGLHEFLPEQVIIALAGLVVITVLILLIQGLMRFRWPSRLGAMTRIDQNLPDHPFFALLDRQAMGTDDPQARALWQAHRARMMQSLSKAQPALPDLRQNRADPYALRYVALMVLSVALFFGSPQKVQSVAIRGGGAGVAGGPSWEGWMLPPDYTGLPTVYLADIEGTDLSVPEGARISLRFYDDKGILRLRETLSGQDTSLESGPLHDIVVAQSGTLEVTGPGGGLWQIAMLADQAPQIAQEGEIETRYEGESSIPFVASDDYAVTSGTARITLDLEAVNRRYGRAIAPEARDAIEMRLPLPVSGRRDAFSESLIADFSRHPWANLPVRLDLEVRDGRGQSGQAARQALLLPARRFFDPLANALIEQRQALLWNRENAPQVALIMRALLNRGEDLFRKQVQVLRLRAMLSRIETLAPHGLSDAQVGQIADGLWELALQIEEGDLEDARQRMQRARERLEEAMRNGASDAQIAELMQELREATEDYMRQLSREQQRQADQGDMPPMDPDNMLEMSGDDIQRMMDRIQELMEQGRMAEAKEAMRQFQQMMENMQMSQGQPGQRGQTPGEQAMEGLSDTLRDQQDLSDDSFQTLNQGPQAGQPGNDQGQTGSGAGSAEQSLADRQRSLRDELSRQKQNLPGQGNETGPGLEEAEEAMRRAEEALREGDLGRAIDEQAQAMEALREGLRNLEDALRQQAGQRGTARDGQARDGTAQEQQDPLGRNQGRSGRSGTQEGLLQGDDAYRRADELLNELRRRFGEQTRPEVEREYLERLLDRF